MFIWYFSREKLIGIGGLNEDPYTENNKIGRLRRFYILKNYRRIGLGKLLLNQLLSYAEKNFKVVVLHTDTKARRCILYCKWICERELFKGSSHYKVLYGKKRPQLRNISL